MTTPTPYQDLIERVRKIDEDAAEYLAGDEVKRLPTFAQEDMLTACFFFGYTPQGFTYWYKIAALLGEVNEMGEEV